jgi:hypothetical protein
MVAKTKGRLLGFTGKMGSGKSTITNQIMDRREVDVAATLDNPLGMARLAVIRKFAGPLKDMLRAVGFTGRDIEGIDKEKPHDLLCGRTPRYAMQTLGTEWGRQMIGPNFWVQLWKHQAQLELDQGVDVLVDDVRFQNELDAVHALGGLVVRVVRNLPHIASNSHASETEMDTIGPVDFTLVNPYDEVLGQPVDGSWVFDRLFGEK